MGFARWVFGIAAIYGLPVTLFGYVQSLPGDGVGMPWRAAFFGAAVATQLLYVALAIDPVRFRPLIVAGIASKASFAAADLVRFRAGP